MEDEALLYIYSGSAWSLVPARPSAARLSINMADDETSLLAVASEASTFSHAGAGHQVKLNRNSAGDTASLLFQTDWLGAAEIGLTGTSSLGFKVSPDGTSWKTGLEIAPDTGCVDVPFGLSGAAAADNLLINACSRVNQRGFAGGVLAAGAYGYDRWRIGTPGFEGSGSDGGISIVSGNIEQVVDLSLSAGEPFKVSAINDGSATLTLDCLGQTRTMPASAECQSVTLVGTASDETAIALTLALSGDGARAARLKLETGSLASAFSERPAAAEALCRYCYQQIGPGPNPYNPLTMGCAVTTSIVSGLVGHAPKRTVPAVTF